MAAAEAATALRRARENSDDMDVSSGLKNYGAEPRRPGRGEPWDREERGAGRSGDRATLGKPKLRPWRLSIALGPGGDHIPHPSHALPGYVRSAPRAGACGRP
ncbi:hypothetical protein GCM10010295_40250 [Streptomyces intermedius]